MVPKLKKEKQMRTYQVLNCAIAAVLLGFASMASAATANANLAVSATVNTNCTIATTPVAFGVYDPNAVAPLNATGTVTIACTKGTNTTIGLGLGSFPSGTTRQMDDSGARLTYELFQPASNAVGAACAYTTVWGATIGTNTLAPAQAPSKVARTYNVCGQMAAGQDPTAGSYSDTVVATVNF
jgi:spore coat protein U-like protein